MLATIGRFILDYIIGKLTAFVYALIEKAKRRKEADQKAKESVGPLKDAKTEKEIDYAAKDALDGL